MYTQGTVVLQCSHLQLRPVLLHALHLQRFPLSLSQLPLTHSCHLRVQGPFHLTGYQLLAAHVFLVPAAHISRIALVVIKLSVLHIAACESHAQPDNLCSWQLVLMAAAREPIDVGG
jgi:hypothetical protein